MANAATNAIRKKDICEIFIRIFVKYLRYFDAGISCHEKDSQTVLINLCILNGEYRYRKTM